VSQVHISESVLNDYADGVLSDSERHVVDVHVAECVECAAELHELQALLATLAQAPRHIAPARDLRPGIAERTSTPVVSLASWRARSLWSARYTLAATAVILIVLSSIVTRVLVQRRTGSAASMASAPASSARDSTAAFAASQPMPVQAPQVRAELVARHSQEFAAVESEYARATDDLLKMLKRERSRLSPEAARMLDQNIRVIDKAIAETRAALRVQPDDAALRSLVRDSYERKLELLRSVAQLTL
jgi:anti-sigma factor RsiW